MKIISLVSAVLLVFSQAQAQQTEADKAKQISEYWKEANLQAIDIEKYVTVKNCSSSAQIYYGCYRAAATLVALSSDENSRLARTASTTESWESTTDQRFGAFEVRTLNSKQIPNERSLEERQKDRDEDIKERAAVGALYKQRKNSEELVKILALSIKALKAETRSESIASALNAYYIYGVDAHAHAHTSKEYIDMMNPESNAIRFFGMGAVIRISESKQPLIAEVLKSSPAQSAGVKPGDLVIAINGEAVAPVKSPADLQAVTDKIRGPESTEVQLNLLRKGKPLEITITRGRVSQDNIEGKILEAADGTKSVYVSVRHFMDKGMCVPFLQKIVDLMNEAKTNNVIVDLRNNGGGLMGEALCMAGAFLRKSGPLLSVWDLSLNQFTTTYSYTAGQSPSIADALGDKPILVLINAGSASASEIFSGIVQDYGVGITVGERSYGKATVQAPASYQTASGARLQMFRTIQRFHLPSKRTNQISGIAADIEVYLTPNPKPEATFALREADLFSHAVEAAKNDYKTPEVIKKVAKSCLAKADPQATFSKVKEDIGYADYQMIVAAELGACL